MAFLHTSVLLSEAVAGLRVRKDGIYIDGTIGGGGHAYEIAKQLSPEAGGRLLGLDQDEAAVEAAAERLAPFRSLLTVVRSNYSNISEVVSGLGIEKADGILLDLGVSSYQLDTPDRGFSYKEDAPLDMRMDQRNPFRAYDVVNNYPETELFHVIRKYGEDKFAKNIAKHIAAAREKKPIESTMELAEIIKAAIPMRVRKLGGHPAKRTFQAIRIEVNHEIEALEGTIDTMIDLLNPGGRLVVITFHSIEDRIVKRCFLNAENPCTCPPEFPVCVCGKLPKGIVITKRPIRPTKEEIESNPRSKSASLRIFERG